MKKVILALLMCILLTGCGSSSAKQEEMELPEGVSLIADHIGVTITDPSEREDPMVTFYGYSEQTAENIYAYMYLVDGIIEMKVDYCEITCCLPNRTPLSYYVPERIEDLTLSQVWVDYAEEKGITDGTAKLIDFIDADRIQNIMRNIDNILEEQLSVYCEDEEDTESTESGEKAGVIKSQDYDLGDGETMSFTLTEIDGVRTLEVYAEISDVDKASMAVNTVLVGIVGRNGYEDWNFGIVCGDNMAVGSNGIAVVSYVDGERGEWLVDAENYTLSSDELVDYHFMILDFFDDFLGQNTQSEEQPEESEGTQTPTMGERNALSKAKDYLSFTAFSYTGLIEQLEFEQFSHEEAVYGADNCGADWNEQAVLKAKSYLEFSAFSKDGLIEQLEYEGFTHEQAVYGVEQNGY